MLSSLKDCQQLQEALDVQPEQLLTLLTTYQKFYGLQKDCRNIPRDSGLEKSSIKGVSRPCFN